MSSPERPRLSSDGESEAGDSTPPARQLREVVDELLTEAAEASTTEEIDAAIAAALAAGLDEADKAMAVSRRVQELLSTGGAAAGRPLARGRVVGRGDGGGTRGAVRMSAWATLVIDTAGMCLQEKGRRNEISGEAGVARQVWAEDVKWQGVEGGGRTAIEAWPDFAAATAACGLMLAIVVVAFGAVRAAAQAGDTGYISRLRGGDW